MIVFKTFNCQIVIKGDEYTLSLEDGAFPNGDECENLVIHTPTKKYTLVGIDSGCKEGYEVMNLIMDFIKDNIDKENIYIDLDDLCNAGNALETIVAFLKVSES